VANEDEDRKPQTLCRNIEPGKMHDLRSASVNNTRLAIIAAWHRLHPFLRYFSTRLFGEVASFVASMRDAKKGVLPQARSRRHVRLMEQVVSSPFQQPALYPTLSPFPSLTPEPFSLAVCVR
jgi:hypothetical protein